MKKSTDPKLDQPRRIDLTDHRNLPINRRIEPYIMATDDPKNTEKKPIKVLTSLSPKRTIRNVFNKRKDDKPMAQKIKTEINYVQTASLVLLSWFAAWGITEMLGGGLKDAVVALMLTTVLFIQAVEFNK